MGDRMKKWKEQYNIDIKPINNQPLLWYYNQQLVIPSNNQLQCKILKLIHNGLAARYPRYNNTISVAMCEYW